MKQVLITGVSRGLGFELVKAFLKAEYSVIGISRSKKIDIEHEHFHLISTDWSNYDTIVNQITSKGLSNHNIVIHNAGVLINKPLDDLNESDFIDSYKVNVVQPFMLTKALKLSGLLAKNAHVVNIGSVGGVAQTKKFTGLGAYSSSKASLSVLTEIMQLEWGHALNFNTLALGAVQTDMLKQANFSSSDAISDVQMAGWIYEFTTKSVDFIAGQTILVKKSDPL